MQTDMRRLATVASLSPYLLKNLHRDRISSLTIRGEKFNDHFSVVAYLSGTMRLLSAQAMLRH